MDTSNKTITVTLTERQARFYVWQSAMRENPAFDDIHEAAADIQNKLNQLEAEAQKAAQANLLNKSMITPDDVEVKFLGFKESDKEEVWVNGLFVEIVKSASYSVSIKGYKSIELNFALDLVCLYRYMIFNPYDHNEPMPVEYMAHLALLNTNWYNAKVKAVMNEAYLEGVDVYVPIAIKQFKKDTHDRKYAKAVIELIEKRIKEKKAELYGHKDSRA